MVRLRTTWVMITTRNFAESVYTFELSRNSTVVRTSSPPWLK